MSFSEDEIPQVDKEGVIGGVRDILGSLDRSFNRSSLLFGFGIFIIPLIPFFIFKFALGFTWLSALLWGLGAGVLSFIVFVVIGIAWENRTFSQAVRDFKEGFPEGSSQHKLAMEVLNGMESSTDAKKKLYEALKSSANRAFSDTSLAKESILTKEITEEKLVANDKGVEGDQTKASLITQIRKGLHYWFVQYNPLYFFSALCILFGMFLISRELANLGWKQWQLMLAVVMQVYEILLLASGAILFRLSGQYRPAVILGIMNIFFLFDCTFQTEMMTSLGPVGIIASMVWVAFTVFKLYALKWVFSLKVPITALIVPILAAIGVAGTPHLLYFGNVDEVLVHMGATWYGVILLAVILYVKPKIECVIPLHKWGQTVLRRTSKAAIGLLAGFYMYHMITWEQIYGIPFTAAQAVPFFLFWFLHKKEALAWVGSVIIVALTSVVPAAVSPVAVIAAVAFVFKARQSKYRRFYVGTVVYVYFALWTIGWQGNALPETKLWLHLAAAIILLIMAWRWRLLSALAALALVTLPSIKTMVPSGPLQWGVLILAVGFIALIGGVAINWRLRKFKPKYEK